MLTWLIVAGIAFAFGGGLAYRIGQRRGRAAALPGASGKALLERTIKDVRPNDVVQHGGQDWLVEGVVTYDEDGHQWRGARMVDGANEAWLIVGLDRTPALDARLYRIDPSVQVGGHPADTITLGETTFTLAKRGNASAATEGSMGAFPATGGARGRWWRYTAAGGRSMLIEQWGDTFRALVGDAIPVEEIELLAA